MTSVTMRILFSGACAATLATAGQAQRVHSSHEPGSSSAPHGVTTASIILTGATVVDGTGHAPRRAAIGIVGERVVYVGDRAGVTLTPDGKDVDVSGRWILPGFIDMHAHLPFDGNVQPFLRTLLAFGTTAIRAPANPQVQLRERIARGELLGPQLLVAGALIYGGDAPYGITAGTESEIRDVVRRQAAQKVDYVKLYVGLTPNLVGAAIAEAHRQHVRVIGHLGRTTWLEAAELGIDARSFARSMIVVCF